MADNSSSTSSPDSGVIDINDLMMKSVAALKGAADGLHLLDGFMGAARQAGATTQKSADELYQGNVSINTSEAQAAAKKQRDNAMVATGFGTNPDVANNLITQLAQKQASVSAEMVSETEDLKKRMGTGFFDDPIQYLWNSLYGEEHSRDRLRGTLMQANDLSDQISRMQEQTTKQFEINSAIDANTSTALLAGKNLVAKAVADKQVAESQIQIAQMGIEANNIRLAHTDEEFKQSLQISQMGAERQRLILGASEAAFHDAQTQFTMDAKKQGLEEEEIWQKQLDAVQDSLGAPRMPWKVFKNFSPEVRAPVEAMIQGGYGLAGVAGPTPARAVDNMDKSNSPGNPGMNIVRKAVHEIVSPIVNEPSYSQLKPEVQYNMKNDKIKADLKTQLGNISEGSMFAAPSLSAVLAIPKIGELTIAKQLSSLAKNPQYGTNVDDVANTALSIINDSKSPAEKSANLEKMAQEISTMFQAIGADNSQQRQYKKFQIAEMAPDTTGYRASVSTGAGSLFGDRTIVDWMNPAAVRNFLMQRTIQSEVNKAGEILGGSNQ